MSQSELINELAAALAKAQGEMQAAIKDKVNPFYKSSYADLGSVWDAARPVLSKNGLCVMQTTEFLDLTSGSNNNQIVMVTTLAHVSGQWVKSYLPLNPTKQDSQGIGAAITYLRRYSLSALVGVVCDDDDDGETSVGRGKTNYKKQDVSSEKIGANEVTAILHLLSQLDDEAKKGFFGWVKTAFNADTVEDLPKEKYQTCMTSLNAKIKYLRSQERVVA